LKHRNIPVSVVCRSAES